ncbi:MAG: DUF1566 domain-containing protein [Desulfonatronovibrio sp.]
MIRIPRMAIVTVALMLCLTRLVMSGTAFGAGGPQCVDNGNGTVTDKGTGLMRQKATAYPRDWNAAMSYASGLSLAGHSDWWLPDQDELRGLFLSPCKDMMDVREDLYWSSITYTISPRHMKTAWHVNFSSGNVNGGSLWSSY